MPAFAGVPALAFVAAFFHGHRWPRRRERYWLDKVCVHQWRGRPLRAAGLAGIPAFVERCDRLVVLHSESYFRRLWCVYEVAVFFASHDSHVDVVPLWVAPWLLATMAAMLAGGYLSLALLRIFSGDALGHLGPMWGNLVSAMIASIGFAVAVPACVEIKLQLAHAIDATSSL